MKAVRVLIMFITLGIASDTVTGQTYTIVDTGQIRCYDDKTEVTYPKTNASFFGQDAQYTGTQPSYRKNGDGTVTDLNTGLMWQADPGEKKNYAQAKAGAAKCRTGGYDDWRLPTIKELYSLILFSGTDPDPTSRDSGDEKPFIDTDYFNFQYGNADNGERIIDSQWATSTLYTGKVMSNRQGMFGVNFADGRIKGYPTSGDPRGRSKRFYVIYVRGNTEYGKNDFVDNDDGTITDCATGLTWITVDSAALEAGSGKDGNLDWQEALNWAENLEYAGHDDWRVPNAKELHSIVDYSRSPDTTGSAAIDPIFKATAIKNEGGDTDYAHYWSSTSHTKVHSAGAGVYIAFGRALGFMSNPGADRSAKTLMDVHGAGAQRSDGKCGDRSKLPTSRGPQGDVMRTYNLVRCVRGGVAEPRSSGPEVAMKYLPRTRFSEGERDRSVGSNGSLDESNDSRNSMHTNGRRANSPRFDGQRPDGPPPDGQRPDSQRPDGPPPGMDLMARLDSNEDGKISKKEFDGPSEHFSMFDQNSNGFLTEDELPDNPPPRGGQHRRRG